MRMNMGGMGMNVGGGGMDYARRTGMGGGTMGGLMGSLMGGIVRWRPCRARALARSQTANFRAISLTMPGAQVWEAEVAWEEAWA